MNPEHQQLFEWVIAPLVSAQLFLAILVYFTIVRKRLAADYLLYVCFLVSFIIFLGGRVLQYFYVWPEGFTILLVRMGLLFCVGAPSLLVAVALQSGVKRSRKLFGVAYGIGFLVGAGYVVFADAGMEQIYISRESLSWLPFEISSYVAHRIQMAGAFLLLVLPCSWLIVREFRGGRDGKLLAFLAGALLFGILMIVGTIPQSFSLYYFGAIISGLCWSWAVFQDIRDMKGKVGLLKDELQLVVQSGARAKQSEIERLLGGLEQLSQGNLDIYKMRVREILNMLTDTTIEAGGDMEALVKRNVERGSAIESSTSPETIHEIARAEVVELSEMIARIPEKKQSVLVEQAVRFLEEHFNRDLKVDELAEALGVSRSHFMREFKKGTGQTVNQYLTSLRIEKAKAMLREQSVTDTAFDVGYNNSNYFSTVFKKSVGVSPAEFQKNLRENDA